MYLQTKVKISKFCKVKMTKMSGMKILMLFIDALQFSGKGQQLIMMDIQVNNK
jgi:hypothetical protein